MTREELERMRAWADAKLATGAEPPWAWSTYKSLKDNLDNILDGLAVTADLPGSQARSESALRLVVNNNSQDIARRRHGPPPVQLPM